MSYTETEQNIPVEVVCIGSANIDIKFFAQDGINLFCANATYTHITFGGVARNVNENLLRLGINASLITCFGDDIEGQLLKNDLEQKGVDISFCHEVNNMKTGVFSVLIDKKGEIFVATISGDDIYRTLDTELIRRDLDTLSRARIIFVDAFLSKMCLEFIIKRCKAEGLALVLNPVSPAFAARLPQDLSGITILVSSEFEIEAITQISVSDTDFCERAVNILHSRGVHSVIITRGEKGVFYSSRDLRGYLASYPANVLDTIGGGDAFIAGVIYSMQKNGNFSSLCNYGLAAASITVESIDTVSKMISPQKLEEKILSNAEYRNSTDAVQADNLI